MSRNHFSDIVNLTSFTDPNVTDLLLTKNRLKTFKEWPFDDLKGSRCTSLELAKAGFIMTMKEKSIPSAKCMCCLKDLMWEKDDKPLNEHLRKMPSCRLAKTIYRKKEIDITVKDVVGILSMREVAMAVDNQLAEDIRMIESGLEYNQNLVDKISKRC
uniref:Baculoviral IAP repeat-containing protein 2 n=1 Tax=Strongyloides venezuelensis TaxID=75913 RepID=A0A0K0F1W6_STRVS